MCVKHWSKGRFYEARPGELLHYMHEHYDGPREHWVDIGAHFGNHVAFALLVLGFEDAVAAEPSKGNRYWLKKNIEGIEHSLNVRAIITAACSDKAGYGYLADIAVPDHSGSKHLADYGEPCALVRLDDILKGDANVIKIDAEGHEKHVIKGAMQTITRCRPWLLVETNDPEGVHAMLPNYEAPYRTANASPTYVCRPCK